MVTCQGAEGEVRNETRKDKKKKNNLEIALKINRALKRHSGHIDISGFFCDAFAQHIELINCYFLTEMLLKGGCGLLEDKGTHSLCKDVHLISNFILLHNVTAHTVTAYLAQNFVMCIQTQ